MGKLGAGFTCGSISVRIGGIRDFNQKPLGGGNLGASKGTVYSRVRGMAPQKSYSCRTGQRFYARDVEMLANKTKFEAAMKLKNILRIPKSIQFCRVVITWMHSVRLHYFSKRSSTFANKRSIRKPPLHVDVQTLQ